MDLRSHHLGCGFGESTFFGFIERGCPTPIPSASSFPYLDLSGLTHEQQQELKGRLWSESQEIMIRFQELVSAIIESPIQESVSQDRLVSHIMTLGAFDPVLKEPQVPVLCHRLKELKAAHTAITRTNFVRTPNYTSDGSVVGYAPVCSLITI